MTNNKNIWLYVAIGLSVLALIGVSLPWAEGMSAGQRTATTFTIIFGTYTGWDLIYVWLPALATIAAYIISFFRNDPKSWRWGALAGSIVTLLASMGYGLFVVAPKETLMFSRIPKVGFWLTLVAFLAIAGLTAKKLFLEKPALPEAPPAQTN
jgi:hypothetical protein